jgi:hypothetical protein
VGERRETRQGEWQHPVTVPPAGIGHEPDAARIVLEPGVVQRRSWAPALRRGILSIWAVHLASAPPEAMERPPP